MELVRTQIHELVRVTAEGSGINIGAGKSLKIETSPGGADILLAVLPPGKAWENVVISVSADEVDA